MFFRTVLDLDDGILGMIMVIHTFGDYARFHPHFHAILASGLFRPNGTFHCLPKTDLKELEGIFRSKVLTMFKAEGRINDGLIEKLMPGITTVSACMPRTAQQEVIGKSNKAWPLCTGANVLPEEISSAGWKWRSGRAYLRS